MAAQGAEVRKAEQGQMLLGTAHPGIPAWEWQSWVLGVL